MPRFRRANLSKLLLIEGVRFLSASVIESGKKQGRIKEIADLSNLIPWVGRSVEPEIRGVLVLTTNPKGK